jgi:lipopolysaccharide transport system ATP-binding protein
MAIALSAEKVGKIFRLGTISTSSMWDGLGVRMRQAAKEGADAVPPGNLDAAAQPYIWALRDVSFKVEQGEVLGIIGRNGAGKSTLLKIISRITGPTQGSIHLHGRVSSLLELGTGFHSELSGRENIFLNAAIHGMQPAEVARRLDEIVEFADIGHFIDTPIKRYSSGMQGRLAFSVAAHLDADILIIDEVLAVGDLEFQKKCLRRIGEASRGGRTVLFVSHRMDHISSLCTRSIVINSGRLVFDGPTSDALAAYYKYFETGGQEPIAERQDRHGRGSARIVGLEVVNESNQSSRVLTTGCTARIRLVIQNRTDAALSGLIAEVDIQSLTGVFVAQLSTRDLGTIDIAANQASTIAFVFDRFILNAGHFALTCRILDAAGREEDVVASAAEFTVDYGDFHGTGQSSGGVVSIVQHCRVVTAPSGHLVRQ